MAQFDITDPKTQKKYRVTAPDGTTPQQALEHFRPQIESGQIPEAGGQPQDNSFLGRAAAAIDPGPFIKGVGQGLIGIPEAIYQGAEKAGAPRVPEAIRAPLRKLRDDADKTWGGVAGETVGNILGFAGGGELLDALGIAAKAPAVVSRVAASPMTQAVIAQPTTSTSTQDYLTQKAEDAGLGWLLNRLFLRRPGQQAAHDVVAGANKTALEKHAADVAATRQANEADLAAHKEATAGDVERHQALSEAQEQFHRGERSKQQQAADALSAQTRRALASRQARLDARSAVPAQTTARWWQRTAREIGETIPGAATPETAAQVQDLVGNRINSITARMHLDPADPAFRENLDEIRDVTHGQLQEHNQKGFFNEPEEEPLQTLLYGPDKRPLERTTRGFREPEPKQPTGSWVNQVLDPLKKGPLTGRSLTNYIRDLGNKANQLATRARAVAPGSPERTDLEVQATALRQVQDAVMGHAAGSPEDKLELERARRAYMLWGIGDDAAKASRGGVATPAQLIQATTKRLGEARYKQALIDPQSPFHEVTTWLQDQLGQHTAQVPSAAQVRAGQLTAPRALPARPSPIPKPSPRTPPTPRPDPAAPNLPEPPAAPKRPRRDYLRAAEHATLGAVMHHNLPLLGWQAARTIDALRGRAGGGTEGSLEAFIRRALTRDPTRAGRVGRAAAATAANRTQKAVPRDLRKAAEDVAAEGARVAAPYLNYRWGSGQ